VDATRRHALWLQFGAAIDTLEAPMRDCPDELWADGRSVFRRSQQKL
jgi:hypothetical protein